MEWDLAKGKLIRNFSENSESIQSMTLTPNGKVLITGTFRGTINFWDWQNRKLLRTWQSDSDPIEAIAISRDQKNIANTANTTIKIWDIQGTNLK
jgi:COMPASS component SWD3